MSITGRRSRSLPLALLGIMGATLAVALWLGRDPGPNQASPRRREEGATPADAKEAPVDPKRSEPSEEAGYVGVVMAPESVEVASTLGGRLESVGVELGDRVKRGSLLARLDSRMLRQDVAVAEATLRATKAEKERAEIRLGEARKHVERVEALGAVVSEQDRSAALSEQRIAQATLEEARAQVDKESARVDQLREQMANTEIRAPFDGTVAARYGDTGGSLAAGAPVVRLLRTGDRLVRFAVPEEAIGGIQRGQRVTFRTSSMHDDLSATVERISPEADSSSQMFVVEARILGPENEAQGLRPGMDGRVFLPNP